LRNKDANQRIRELEAELAKLRISTEAQLTRAAAELETIRRQATTRRAPATVFIGNLKQSEVNSRIRKREIGDYSDGGNLQLQIRHGAKPDSNVVASWLFRWTETLRPGLYKPRTMGLGSARVVPLQEARQKAQHYRRLLDEGKDPKVERLNMLCEEQSTKDRLRTFEQVGDEYIEKKISKRSPGYQQRMRQLLRTNVLNKEHKLITTGETKMIKVGALPIQRVTRNVILDDCGFEQFWNEQYPSARDLRMLLDKMYDYARERGYYIGNSPMAWRGALEHVLQAPKDVHTVKHDPALTYQSAPTFLQQCLRQHRYHRSWPRGIAPNGQPVNCLMIELAMLTAARISEIIAAEWQELDFTTMTWTVPWEHTKRKEPDQPHRMPITRSMLAIFQLMQGMRVDPSPQAPIFPSHHKRWVQSDRRVGSQTLMRVVRQLQPGFEQDFVNHGFRSTFKGWCDATGKPDDWSEKQLHHKKIGKTKQAYDRNDLLDQRRPMMAEWDGYLNAAPLPAKVKEDDNVIELTERKRRNT